MNDLIQFLTSKEIIAVYIVVAVACLLCFIIYLFDKSYYKRKRRQNTKELNKLVESVNEELEKEKLTTLDNKQEAVVESVVSVNNEQDPKEPILTPIVEPIVEKTKDETIESLENQDQQYESEKIEYTNIEPDLKEAQEELQKLTEELEKMEQETSNIDLTSFEEEQEKNAIISLDELLAKEKVKYENNEFALFEDDGNEPISLKDLEQMKSRQTKEVVEIAKEEKKEPIQEQMVLDEFNNIKIEQSPRYQNETKFKTSPVISPVFGIEQPKVESVNELELENTANYEKLDEEIKKTNEFLMTLKELQKKLD